MPALWMQGSNEEWASKSIGRTCTQTIGACNAPYQDFIVQVRNLEGVKRNPDETEMRDRRQTEI